MRPNPPLLLAAVLHMTIFTVGVSAKTALAAPGNCQEWNAKVDPRIEGKIAVHAGDLSDSDLIAAMGCLLKNQGNRGISRISGATNPSVSQKLPQATVELASLYYISYLFTGNYQHADGVALWNDQGIINPPGSVESAYKAYAAWFKQVKLIGIGDARKQRLDPLKGTNLRWFGR